MTWLEVGGYASAGDSMVRVDFNFPIDKTRVVLGRWPEHAAWLLVGTEFEDDWNYCLTRHKTNSSCTACAA